MAATAAPIAGCPRGMRRRMRVRLKDRLSDAAGVLSISPGLRACELPWGIQSKPPLNPEGIAPRPREAAGRGYIAKSGGAPSKGNRTRGTTAQDERIGP